MKCRIYNVKTSKHLVKIANYISLYFRKTYYGFLLGHHYIEYHQLLEIQTNIEMATNEINNDFEVSFSKLVGDGNVVSFAAGRMGFYSLLKQWDIKVGDEVILLGFTCSVMANAVLRSGATPRYSDIDPNTFGSSLESIEKVITNNTKVIVAQHTFGIPCKIEPIVKFCKENNIHLVEDCALTLGSKVNGRQVGNFGDAAIFSLDHSKPINSIIGGLIYTRDKTIYRNLKLIQSNSTEISQNQKSALFYLLKFERKYFKPTKYGKSKLVFLIKKTFSFKNFDGYLSEDFTPSTSGNKYPYPARFPEFLAALGLIELKRWDVESKKRKQNLKDFLIAAEESGINKFLPKAYYDKNLDIIPLRFIYGHPNHKYIKNKLKWYLQTSWFWFAKPIIACDDPKDFGYIPGACINSESSGQQIINWPCIFSKDETKLLINIFKQVHFE